jgi:molecular chaperone HtpG
MTIEPQTHAFQAEVARILELMVHSVYTEKDIFLRELIANASDALDKLRYLALTDPSLTAGDGSELSISIELRPADRTLLIADNGIGMSSAEMVENLGTIARSGTKAFLDKVAADKAGENLIGQFGVGFYSAFMVADRIEVVSAKSGTAEASRWISAGGGGFSIEPLSAEAAATVRRGTTVKLHLKEDASEFLDESRIEDIVRSYSDHILFPIRILGGKPETDGKPAPDAAGRQINSASALWTRPKAEITAEQYKEFYRSSSLQFDDPAVTIHYRAEGRHEYAVLLFVPGSAPFDLFDGQRKGRIRLYVRRVFITDDANLLPSYLRFVRGVVDSADMPLNISREMLQNNPMVAAIRKALTGRVLSELKALAEKEPEAYARFWQTFGAVLKEGLYEDHERRDALYELARFASTASSEQPRSLKDYVAALKPNQTEIYYLTGETLDRLKASPQLEGFRARGIEVLLLSDPVDNFWVMTALGFEGKPFRSVTQGDARLDAVPLAEGAKTPPPAPISTAQLVEALKRSLGAAVSDVKVSSRLVDSPACLVAAAAGPDRGMDKIMSKQTGRGAMAPVLEINAGHKLVEKLEKSRTGDTTSFDDFAWLLLDQALILEGGTPNDPAKFAERMNRMLLAGP